MADVKSPLIRSKSRNLAHTSNGHIWEARDESSADTRQKARADARDAIRQPPQLPVSLLKR